MNIKDAIKGWDVYVITDETLANGRSNVDIARAALDGGARVIQLRDKVASSHKLYHDAIAIRRLTRQAGATFIVNDRLDIALASDADGLHIGRKDLPAQIVRKFLGVEKILGISAASLEEAEDAYRQSADYLGVGPVFEARQTKSDADPPIGLENLKLISNLIHLPIVAIGGINTHNINDVITAGAGSVAIISAIVTAENIADATHQLIRKMKHGT
ncbi:thiamine phosphate synthase [candidate division KSB1 bacterium]|nr:thiamine phosphate synthase [candidate division KSB1 bacterium]